MEEIIQCQNGQLVEFMANFLTTPPFIFALFGFSLYIHIRINYLCIRVERYCFCVNY